MTAVPQSAAVIYAAKSTADHHGSIPAQLDDCRAMAAAAGWLVVAERSDEGFSAYSGNRGPGLEAAKRDAAEAASRYGGCALVVQHSDRLARGDGRGSMHLAQLWWWAFENDIQLRSVQDDGTLNDPLLATVMGMRNNEDSRRKARACRDGARRRVAERGRHQGGYTPYGYDLAKVGDRDERQLVPRRDQAAIVARIFSEYLGGAGHGRIAHDLNRDGVAPPRAERWDKSTVAAMIANPVFCGRVHINGETFEGRHEAIVDVAVWERVQRVRAARRDTAAGRGRLPSGPHLLTKGLLRCSCGAAMSARTFRNRPGLEVYLCSTRRVTGGSEVCQQPQVSRESIDTAVLAYFSRIGLDEEQTLTQLRDASDRQLREARALREQAARELAEAEERLQRFRRDYADGRLDAASWRSFMDEYEPEREAAAAALARQEERERSAEEAAAARDVEAETLGQLARVRAIVAGRIASPGDVAAVRAALSEVFSSFTLRPAADARDAVPRLWLGGYLLEPTVRPEALVPTLLVQVDENLALTVTDEPGPPHVRRTALSLPPDADSTSALSNGTNALLRLGATPLTSPADVLESFGLAGAISARPPVGGDAATVLARLHDAGATADELAVATGLAAGAVAAALTQLELAGLCAGSEGRYRVL